ncbi:hypothetical protein ACFL16_02935 [Patescibacteria group bacterium]
MKEFLKKTLIIFFALFAYLIPHELGHATKAIKLGIAPEEICIGIPNKKTRIASFNLVYINTPIHINWVLLGIGIKLDLDNIDMRSNNYLSILRSGVMANIICASIIITLGILLHKETGEKRTKKLILVGLLTIPLLLSEIFPLLLPILGIQLIMIAIKQNIESGEFLISPFLYYESRATALENISGIILGVTIVDSSVIPLYDGGRTLFILLDRYGII